VGGASTGRGAHLSRRKAHTSKGACTSGGKGSCEELGMVYEGKFGCIQAREYSRWEIGEW
jgi:hypothetical protein